MHIMYIMYIYIHLYVHIYNILLDWKTDTKSILIPFNCKYQHVTIKYRYMFDRKITSGV